MVGVALFGSNVSERLRSSREEFPVSMIILPGTEIVSRLAHRNIGRVTRTIFFKVMFRMR